MVRISTGLPSLRTSSSSSGDGSLTPPSVLITCHDDSQNSGQTDMCEPRSGYRLGPERGRHRTESGGPPAPYVGLAQA